MSLYSTWQNIANQHYDQESLNSFWETYFNHETENYKKILANHEHKYHGTVAEIAAEFGMDNVTFLGFLDGINTSLVEEFDLDKLEENTEITLDIDYEKLYYNMHVCKADWLYNLKEWDGVLSVEKRDELTKKYRSARVFINHEKVGRNDPCPCGSGKKYKNCCGAKK